MKTTKEADPVDIAVGARVRTIRKGLGMSQSALAEQLGLTFQQVQKYERGFNRISCSTLVRVARALQVSIVDLFGDETGQRTVAEDVLGGARIAGAPELIQNFAKMDPRGRHALSTVARALVASCVA